MDTKGTKLLASPSQEPAEQARIGKATLLDVAAAVGVSKSTVSRALSRPEMVRPEVRASIARVCEELGYIPNHVARSLSTDRSRAIGAIIPTIENPVFAPMISGMLEVLDPLNYALLVNICHRDAAREHAQTVSLIERGIDAVLLGNPEHRPETLDLLQKLGMPFVCVGGSARDMSQRSVTFDGRQAMKLAVDLLVNAGHRRIAILSGPAAITPVIADRIEGAVAALKRHGVAPPPQWIVECGFDAADVRAGSESLVSARQCPTAVVCTGDQHALTLISVCHSRGLQVPHDISITGCNDMFYTQFSKPTLTTIRTPYNETGRRSAAMALDLIAGNAVEQNVLLESVLIDGETVTAPRKRAKL